MDPENASPCAEEPVLPEAVIAEPQEPRLSIMHLLVWTACVAVYFSFIQTRAQYVQAQYAGVSGVFPVLYGLGFGTALAGLVLLTSRRLRGFPLAKHPGEYLLLSAGASLVFVVVMQAIDMLISPQWSPPQYLFPTLLLASPLANALILLLAAIQVKARRWRVFFVIAILALALRVLSTALHFLLLTPGLFSVYFDRFLGTTDLLYFLVRTIATVTLMIVVLMDLRGRKRYPWQHWMGAGLRLWFGAINFVPWVFHYVFP